MSKPSKEKQTRQKFLHTFFPNKSQYETVEVNGFTLEKHLDGNTGRTVVAIYPKESWKNKQLYKQGYLDEFMPSGEKYLFNIMREE